MAINAQDVARQLISYAVVTDKNGLVKLLERNGIQMPNNPSDSEVTVAVLAASGKSQTFKNDLAKYLTIQADKAAKSETNFVGDSTDFGFTGIDDFSFTGGEDFFNIGGLDVGSLSSGVNAATSKTKVKSPKPSAANARASRVTETNPQGKTGFGLFLQRIGQGLTSQDTVNAGINLGLTAINNRIQGRSNAVQQEAVVLTQQQDQLRQQITTQKKAGLSTTSWVFIGIGVIALGGIIFYIAKKK